MHLLATYFMTVRSKLCEQHNCAKQAMWTKKSMQSKSDIGSKRNKPENAFMLYSMADETHTHTHTHTHSYGMLQNFPLNAEGIHCKLADHAYLPLMLPLPGLCIQSRPTLGGDIKPKRHDRFHQVTCCSLLA